MNRLTRNAAKLTPRRQIDPDDGLGRGMDIALVTLVFLGIGYVLDRVLDTKPLFMIVLFVFSVVGQTVKIWIGYDARMKVLEAEHLSNRQGNRQVNREGGGR